MDKRKRADDAPEAGPREELVLWVRLTPGERLTGFVGRSAPNLSHSFNGWIDFMGALNALRASRSGPGIEVTCPPVDRQHRLKTPNRPPERQGAP